MPKQTTSTALGPVQSIAEVVSVMDQHGQVVHNGSKTFFSALREAKAAYRARKAEIALERQSQRRAREKTMLPRRQTDSIVTIQNGSHHSSSSKDDSPRKRPSRRHTTKAICEAPEVREDALVRRNSSAQKSRRGSVPSVEEDPIHPQEVATRNAAGAAGMAGAAGTVAAIDAAAQQITAANHAALDMAPALFSDPSVVAIQTLLARVQSIIDEIQCLSAGLTTLITELQKTPETFAAVGLSLAEIAQMVTHIAPAATIVLKSTFPTIFALISSPHFAIVAGVAGAATVVVLGGYKIVKNIMAGADDNLRMAYGELPDEDLLEETDLGGEVLGEVVEDQRRMLEQAKAAEEKVEELPPVGLPARSSPSKREKKALMSSEDPVERQFKPESRLFGIRGKEKEEKKEKVLKEKVLKEENKVLKAEKEEKKTKHEKKSEKEKEERRKEKERRDKTEEKLQEERRKEKERRKSSKQNSSTSSGVSSNRSESSLEHRTKEKSKSSSGEKEKSKPSSSGEKEKEKKKFSMKAMFSGKSV